MASTDPVASILQHIDAIEDAVAHGRLEEFADRAESLGAALDVHSLQSALLNDQAQAQKLNSRLNRLGGVLGYMRALQQALQGLSQPADEAYSSAAPSPTERRTAAWEA